MFKDNFCYVKSEKNENKTALKVSIIFLIVGILMASINGVMYINYLNFMESAVPVQAYIEKIDVFYKGDDESHRVFVSYQYNDEEVYTYLNEYSSTMNEGDYITVYYDPNNPYKNAIKFDSFYIAFILGGMFFIFLSFLLIKLNKKETSLFDENIV